jgi:hypothetical protein
MFFDSSFVADGCGPGYFVCGSFVAVDASSGLGIFLALRFVTERTVAGRFVVGNNNVTGSSVAGRFVVSQCLT